MAQRIFISYGRKDDYLTPVSLEEEHTYHHDPTRSFTRQLYDALIAAGFDVWWDRERMPNRGLTFLQEIRQAVHDSDKLVYVSGDHASKSDYVKAEWQYALSQCKPVIPLVRNGDYALIPSEISMGNAPDVRDMRFFDEKIKELIRLLSDATRPTATLYGVPTLPDWYVERGNDVADLQKAIRADALKPIVVTSKQQTITLQGMGGLGKTTLATALCKRCDVRQSFPDGIFWLEMGKTPSVATRQGDIGVAFGDVRDEYPDEQRGKARLSDLLRNRAALIVLDDVWDHRHVEAFRIDSPASRVMVTTRDGRMATLLGVSQHTIDTLTAEEGMALIGKRLGRAEGEASAHADAERKLVELLGGHTLAISIAAARIAEEGADYVPRYLQRLQDRRAKAASPLGDLKMHDDDKNYNLELSLAESYDELKPTEQAYFRALGVFAVEGSFDRAALQAVWDLQDEYAAEDAVNALLKFALLSKGDGGRYSVHGLLRAYALQLLKDAGEAEGAHPRHFAHYIALHGDYGANQAYAEDGTLRQHARITQDWDNIQTALAWGWTQEAQKSVDWVWALDAFMMLRRTNAERQALLEKALEVAQANDYRLGLANTLKAMGDLHSMKNDYEQARASYERALTLYEDINDRLGLANTLKAMGDLHSMKNDYEQARASYDRAVTLYEDINDRLGLANTLKAMGDLHRMKNDYEQARASYERALTLYEDINERIGLANTLQAMGELFYVKNDYEQARASYDRAVTLFEDINERIGLANTLHAMGDLHRMKNDYGQARASYDRALTLFEDINNRLGLANTLKAMGDLFYVKNDYEQARASYDRAVKLYEDINERLGLANTLRAMGDLSLRLADYEQARASYDRAVTLYEDINNRRGLANTLKAMGDLHRMKNDYEQARASYDRAVTLYEDINDRRGLANTLQAMGDLHRMKNDYSTAVERYQRALALGQAIGDFTSQLNSLKGLAFTYHAQRDLPNACRYAQALLTLADSHPSFQSHPVVDACRKTFAGWGCG